jgi:hypothetical protein
MGRTVPSFRIAFEMEKAEWKPFRNALDKSDRKKFEEMFDIPKSYISACSNSLQYVRLHPILMSILFHHYKQLTECISEVERIEAKVKNSRKKRRGLRIKEEVKENEKEEELSTTLDSFTAANSN